MTRSLAPADRDHLLRTLAAVAPGARVLSIATGTAADLARLGFDVWACGPEPVDDERNRLGEVLGDAAAARRVTPARPEALGYGDDTFDWAAVSLGTEVDVVETLREVRRVVTPGAWIWVAAEVLAPDEMVRLGTEAGLVVAEAVVASGARSRGIFRRVEAGVAG
ncbi:MAG: hypothetical protein AAF791_05160 [Bacteroidota bacterium]